MSTWRGDCSFVDGFKAYDARVIVIFDNIVRSLIDFFESALEHSLPYIDLFFHALGWLTICWYGMTLWIAEILAPLSAPHSVDLLSTSPFQTLRSHI